MQFAKNLFKNKLKKQESDFSHFFRYASASEIKVVEESCTGGKRRAKSLSRTLQKTTARSILS